MRGEIERFADLLDLQTRSSRECLFDWFSAIVEEQYDYGSWSSQGHSCEISTLANERFRLGIDRARLHVWFEGPDSEHAALEAMVRRAHHLASLRAPGPGRWWNASLLVEEPGTEAAMLQFVERLGSQRALPREFRLGSDVLVEATKETSRNPPGPLRERFDIHFRVGAPWIGVFSRQVARENLATIRSIVAFAIGRRLENIFGVFPVEEESELRRCEERSSDSAIPELLLSGRASLVATKDLVGSESDELIERIRGAFSAFEEALHQRTQESFVVYAMTAIEALSMSNASWNRKRVSARFVELFCQVGEAPLKAALAHPNLADAIGPIKTPKRLAQALYDLRSRPLHSGHIATRDVDFMAGMESKLRVAIVSELVRETILRFMERPLSCLVGHPCSEAPEES